MPSGNWSDHISITSISQIGGGGTSTNPYLITTAEEFVYILTYINGIANDGGSDTYQKYIRLDSDIDLSAHYYDIECNFHGNFNGNGKKISNVYMKDDSSESRTAFALFTTVRGYDIGSSTFTTCIHDLILEDISITISYASDASSVSVGALIGRISQLFVKIYNITAIRINIYCGRQNGSIGGLIGYTYRTNELYNIDVDGLTITCNPTNSSGTMNVGCLGGQINSFNASYISDKNGHINIIDADVSLTTCGSTIYFGGLFGACSYPTGALYLKDVTIDCSIVANNSTSTSELIQCGGLIGYMNITNNDSGTSNRLLLSNIVVNRFTVSQSTSTTLVKTLIAKLETYKSTNKTPTDEDKTDIYINSDNVDKSLESGISGFDNSDSSEYNLCSFTLTPLNVLVDNKLNRATWGMIISYQLSDADTKFVRGTSDLLLVMNPHTLDNRNGFKWYVPIDVDNGMYRSFSVFDINFSILTMYIENGVLTVPNVSKYGYLNPSFYIKNDSATLHSDLHPGDIIKLYEIGDTIDETLIMIYTDTDLDTSEKIVKYKTADSTIVDVENIHYCNSNSIITEINNYLEKTTSGELV